MLRLVFYTQYHILKVRHALPDDSFADSFIWHNKLECIISPSKDFMMTWTSLIPDLPPEYAHPFVNLVGARYPVSPDFEKLKNICPEMVFKNGTDEWVFFGGSFHPWHQGHQACLSLLPEDKICLVVPDRNPHKDLRELDPVSTVLEISAKARFKKNQFIVPTFLLEHKKNPTVLWVEKLKADFPTHKISLLMGFDSFSQIKTWTRASDLVPKLSTVYVVSRLEGDDDRRLALDEARALGPNLDVIFLGKHDYEYLSSTSIRNRL